LRRRTKIVATYGPAIAAEATLARVIGAGADVLRLNFSHGDHAQHAAAILRIRKVAGRLGKPVAILQDLRGPKIRVGTMRPDPLPLRKGERIVLGTGPAGGARPAAGAANVIPVEGYPGLARDVSAGQSILLNDGAIRLRVLGVVREAIRCEVLDGGTLGSHQGVNLPETPLRRLETITAKDRRDLLFGLEHGVDWIALSFVRSAEDVRRLKGLIQRRNVDVPVMAKIEKREALQALDEIVEAADGVMVARGDLGVETNLSEVALRQKEIIRACNRKGRVVVTATQMLESMVHHPRPTRAEVSDVSNAIIDGSDAVMLSGETAAGEYPIEAVRFMDQIALRTEAMLALDRSLATRPYLEEIPDAVAHAACVTAQEIDATALICCTRSGLTARLVSRYRPGCPVVAVSPEIDTVRRLAIVWGVTPLSMRHHRAPEALLSRALAEARKARLVRKGERVVLTAGMSGGPLLGRTNLMRVEIA
jgi:pyruvate kinase